MDIISRDPEAELKRLMDHKNCFQSLKVVLRLTSGDLNANCCPKKALLSPLILFEDASGRISILQSCGHCNNPDSAWEPEMHFCWFKNNWVDRNTASLSLCLCLCFPFHLWLHFWLLWKTFKRSHTHTHTHESLGKGPQSCLSPRGAGKVNWNVHCFQTKRSPQISPPRSSMGGKGCILGVICECVCVCVLRDGVGVAGGWFGFGHVGAFAKSTNQITAEPAIPHRGLFFLCCFFFAFSHCFPLFLSDPYFNL